MPRLPKSKSFFNKLFLSFLAVSVVISALLCTFMTASYQKNATAMLEQFYARVMKQTNYSVTYMNDLAKRATTSLYSDKDVVAFLNMQAVDNMTTVLANIAVRKLQIPMAYVDSVYLYNAQADLLLSTKNGAQYTLDTFYDTEITTYLLDPQRLQRAGSRPVASPSGRMARARRYAPTWCMSWTKPAKGCSMRWLSTPRPAPLPTP